MPVPRANERHADLDACARQILKRFAKYPSPLDCPCSSAPPSGFCLAPSHTSVARIVDGWAAGDEGDDAVLLTRGQYSHVFPHRQVRLKCCICEGSCPSDAPLERMMVLFNSPAPYCPLCAKCSVSFGKTHPTAATEGGANKYL